LLLLLHKLNNLPAKTLINFYEGGGAGVEGCNKVLENLECKSFFVPYTSFEYNLKSVKPNTATVRKKYNMIKVYS